MRRRRISSSMALPCVACDRFKTQSGAGTRHDGAEGGPFASSRRTIALGPKKRSGVFHPLFWRIVMRKTLAVTAATGALLFGGAGVASATAPSAPVPSSTTTTVAQNDNDANKKSDKTGLWGLVGLAGLAGLAGLVRRRDDRNPGAGTPGTPGPGTHGQIPPRP